MTHDGPLFVQQGICGSDISTHGRDVLLYVVITYVNREPGSANRFSGLVSDIIDLAERTASSLLEEHATSIHQWCPIIDEELLQKGRDGTYDDLSSELLPSPLIFLCILLLSRTSCPHPEPIRTSILYTTIKQMIAIGQTSGEVSLELFRAGMLVAVYECGHGMAAQAFVTLSACVALLDLIKLDMRKPSHDMLSEEIVSSLNAAIIMLDRMIPLSNMDGPLPLVCPTKQPLSTHVANMIEPAIPPPSPTPYASSPRKVHIRAIVALESGRVLEYIGAIQRGAVHVETYDEVDVAMATVIKKLVDKPQPHTWLHCDAIAMAFWSVHLHDIKVFISAENVQFSPSPATGRNRTSGHRRCISTGHSHRKVSFSSTLFTSYGLGHGQSDDRKDRDGRGPTLSSIRRIVLRYPFCYCRARDRKI